MLKIVFHIASLICFTIDTVYLLGLKTPPTVKDECCVLSLLSSSYKSVSCNVFGCVHCGHCNDTSYVKYVGTDALL